VADLGEGALPFAKTFSIFLSKNERKIMDLKKWFLATTVPPFEKKNALPFQNPRSATGEN
jgi:hypothetical protein